MIVEGKVNLKAPVQKVWDYAIKAENIAACVPGVEKITQKDEKTYDCLMKQSVGPISVKIQFQIVLTETDPPTHVRAQGRGEALGKMGTFTMDMKVDLKELSKEDVEVTYWVDANIVGKLATFGERLMRAKAKAVVDDFANNLQTNLKKLSK
jgi:carbon monoxide dehydrogenase subunit G